MINVNSAVVASGSQANPALLADKNTPSTKLQARDLHANDASMEAIVSRLLCQTKGHGNKGVKTGDWGGEQIGMTVNKNGASLGSVDISSSPNQYSDKRDEAQKILRFLFKP